MCDYGYRSVGQLDSQRSIPDAKRGNVTSTPQTLTFGRQFLAVQTQTFIDENFCFPEQLHRFRSLNFEFVFVRQDFMNVLTAI